MNTFLSSIIRFFSKNKKNVNEEINNISTEEDYTHHTQAIPTKIHKILNNSLLTINICSNTEEKKNIVEMLCKDKTIKKFDIKFENGILEFINKGKFSISTSRYKATCNVYTDLNNIISIVNVSCGDIIILESLNSKKHLNFETESSGSIIAYYVKTEKNVTLRSNGPGNTLIKYLKANSVNINSSSTGDIEIKSGSCELLELTSDSVGIINTQCFKAKDAEVSISSVGDAYVYASNTIQKDVSSLGELFIFGNPK